MKIPQTVFCFPIVLSVSPGNFIKEQNTQFLKVDLRKKAFTIPPLKTLFPEKVFNFHTKMPSFLSPLQNKLLRLCSLVRSTSIIQTLLSVRKTNRLVARDPNRD